MSRALRESGVDVAFEYAEPALGLACGDSLIGYTAHWSLGETYRYRAVVNGMVGRSWRGTTVKCIVTPLGHLCQQANGRLLREVKLHAQDDVRVKRLWATGMEQWATPWFPLFRLLHHPQRDFVLTIGNMVLERTADGTLHSPSGAFKRALDGPTADMGCTALAILATALRAASPGEWNGRATMTVDHPLYCEVDDYATHFVPLPDDVTASARELRQRALQWPAPMVLVPPTWPSRPAPRQGLASALWEHLVDHRLGYEPLAAFVGDYAVPVGEYGDCRVTVRWANVDRTSPTERPAWEALAQQVGRPAEELVGWTVHISRYQSLLAAETPERAQDLKAVRKVARRALRKFGLICFMDGRPVV